MANWDKCHTVYIAAGEHGYKIGISSNMGQRRKDIKAKFVHEWSRPKDAAKIEFAARQLLKGRNSYGYETYDVTEEQMVEAVEKAIQLVESGQHPKSPRELKAERAAKEAEWMRKHAEAWTEWQKSLEE